MLLMSDGRVPEYGCLCRVRGRTDLFGPAAFYPAWEDRCTFLLALISLLGPVLAPLCRRWPVKRLLQLWMLPGAYLHAEAAFPLDLL